MLAIEGVAVGISQGDDFLLLAVGIDAENLVQGLVAYIQKSGLIPHGAFREPETCSDCDQLGRGIDEPRELRRNCLEFKGARGLLRESGGWCEHCTCECHTQKNSCESACRCHSSFLSF